MAGRQPTPSEVSERIHDILSRPEFGRAEPSGLERFRQWFKDLFARLGDRVGGGGGSSIRAYILFALILAALVGLVIWWLRRAVREHAVEERAAATRYKTARDWNAEAAVFAAQGKYRDAVRCRYKGLVALLAERHLVREVPGRTAGELRNDVRRDVPAAAPPFDEASTLFERAWYGAGTVTEQDLAQFDEFSAAVQRASR